jgi:hypothetical protein
VLMEISVPTGSVMLGCWAGAPGTSRKMSGKIRFME